MPLDFPSSPAVGTYYNGYIWDGTVWDSALQPSVPALLTTAPVYANEAARTTAVPSPAEGQLSYLNDINQFQGYAGSSWRPVGGLAPVVPPTVNFSGGSATSNSSGLITFNSVSSVSLNNVFSSAYRNYRVIISGVVSSAYTGLTAQLRNAGTNAATEYWVWGIRAVSSAGITQRGANTTSGMELVTIGTGAQTIVSMDIGTPFLAQNTQFVSQASGFDTSSSMLQIMSAFKNDVTSYDGIHIFSGTGTFSGAIQVLGYNS